MLDAVVIHNFPEAVSIRSAIAREEHGVVRRGEAATRRQAAYKGGCRLIAVVEDTAAARATSRRRSSGKDSVG